MQFKERPHEAWTNENPSVDHLKVFGCLCYSHVAKDERQKLDIKAIRCIMLGYGTETKAYRLYDVERKKVFYSRNVIFNEAASGKEEAMNKTSDIKYVQLECLNDEEVHNDVAHDGHDLHEDEEVHNDLAHDEHDLHEDEEVHNDVAHDEHDLHEDEEVHNDVAHDEHNLHEDEKVHNDVAHDGHDLHEDEEVHNDIAHDEHDLHEDEEVHNDVVHDGHDLNEPVKSIPELRCSSREKKMPDFYGIRVTVADGSADPVSLMEALSNSDKAYWKDAMEKEVKSLSVNKVWDLVSLPKGKKVVGSKWVFKTKRNVDGNVERYKARLVAQGYSHKYVQDYDETFSPVVRFESLRMIIALSVQRCLKMHQMDVTTAFLNGELNDEVYMKQPEGYVVKGKESLVCKLKKSIYGLKQSPRCWNSVLDQFLKKIGFVQATSDPCLYIASEGELFLIAVYVDDIVIAGSSDVRMKEVKQALSQKFQVKDLGELHYFLGVKVIQNQKNRTVWIGQQAYAEDILKKFGMEDAKPVQTPVDTSIKLTPGKSDDACVDQKLFQSAVGSLLYLSIATRPDITYAVSHVAKFCAKPTQQHWLAVKCIFGYLKGTKSYGILYCNDSSSHECVGYSDADWGDVISDRKSTSGYMFQISGAAISWRTNKQTCGIINSRS